MDKETEARAAELLGPMAQPFRLLIVCDEVVREEQAPREAFACSWPTRPVRASTRLYRCHVREMCRRVAAGEDVDLGTDAEALGTLSALSLQAPLRPHAVALFEYLFAKLFPDDAPRDPPAELYRGQIEEDLRELKRRIAVRPRMHVEGSA